MCMIQQREMEKPTYSGAFTLRSFQQEFMGLIMVVWNTLKRQVVLMDTPLLTLRTYKRSLHPVKLCLNLFQPTESLLQM